ncbi:MAG: hypothetical protein LQ340_004305 [Diploschistes diacapsis]|nr:MAG: hypothetical protein LQ340_004305 [Diploschistes diacapsis]
MAQAVKRQRISEDGDAVTTALAGLKEDFHEPSSSDSVFDPPKAHTKLSRSLFVRSLPLTTTTQSLAAHFSQSYLLRHATVVVDRDTQKSKGYGFVTFADAEDAQRARTEFDGSRIEGKRIRVEVAEPRHREVEDEPTTGSKKSRPAEETLRAKANRLKQKQDIQPPPKLIIRNLPWSIKDADQLALLFRSYGKVKHAILPKQKPGLSPGFGFVILRGRKNAEKALIGVNGKTVDGRTLAVDWAVEKEAWQQLQRNPESSQEVAASGEADDPYAGDQLAMAVGEPLQHTQRSEPPADKETSSLEDERFDRESDTDLGYSTAGGAEDLDQTSQRPEEDYSTTLFVRNLPFTATDAILLNHFQQFGPLRYARVVMDLDTERSKGTGFVCFRDSEDALKCLRRAPRTARAAQSKGTRTGVKHSILEDTQVDPLGHFTIDGRVLQVSRAVDRGEAQRLTVQGQTARESRDKDKRRLYLLAEGTVSPDSQLYATLVPSEIRLREESAKQRQSMVKNNPSLHMSLTRLSVRNIPHHVTSKDLKALAREAVVGFATDVKEGRRQRLSKEELSRGSDVMKAVEHERKAKGRGIVKQAHIVFEGREGKKVGENTGAGRSRGYGFVEYYTHRCALMGLRWLNGSQVAKTAARSTDSGTSARMGAEKNKRLIVEFAIENAQVVARREAREGKAQRHSGIHKQGTRSHDSGNETGLAIKSTHDRKPEPNKRKRSIASGDMQETQPNVEPKLNDKSEEAGNAKRIRIIAKKRASRRLGKK